MKSKQTFHLVLISSTVLCNELIIYCLLIKHILNFIRVLCWHRSTQNSQMVVIFKRSLFRTWMGFSFWSGGVKQILVSVHIHVGVVLLLRLLLASLCALLALALIFILINGIQNFEILDVEISGVKLWRLLFCWIMFLVVWFLDGWFHLNMFSLLFDESVKTLKINLHFKCLMLMVWLLCHEFWLLFFGSRFKF